MNGTDREFARVREYAAAAIAVIVIIGTAVMFGFAVSITGDKDRFPLVKDIIQISVPFVSFVLGYYFSKSSTESRAESAEESLKGVTRLSETAIEERKNAVRESNFIKSETGKTKEALQELVEAAQPLAVDDATYADSLLGDGDRHRGAIGSENLLALQKALKKAVILLGER